MTGHNTRTEVARDRIDQLFAKYAQLSAVAEELNLSHADRDALLSSTRHLLERMYSDDLRLAELIDQSDLLVGAVGPQMLHDRMPINTVIGLLTKTKDRVLDVVKTIATITGRVPPNVQPQLHGLAPGSVYLGFLAPSAAPDSLFSEETPYFAAVREAMRAIRVVSHLIADEASLERLAEAVPDPGTRDAAVGAIADLAPAPQSTYDRLIVSGRGVPEGNDRQTSVLQVDDRKRIKSTLSSPATQVQDTSFIGRIREIDLDKRRFYIRQVEGLPDEASIRGVYAEAKIATPKTLLDRRVRVAGRVESDPDGRPKLIFVDGIEVLDT